MADHDYSNLWFPGAAGVVASGANHRFGMVSTKQF